jgi:hypothetical protein
MKLDTEPKLLSAKEDLIKVDHRTLPRISLMPVARFGAWTQRESLRS